jgi:hypothetical protein
MRFVATMLETTGVDTHRKTFVGKSQTERGPETHLGAGSRGGPAIGVVRP